MKPVLTTFRRHAPRSRAGKILLSIAVLGAAASIAGLGTFATFTSTTSASHTVASGTVVIALGASGSANRLSVGATGLAPGDTLERAVDVINNGTLDMASVTLATSATTSSLLDTDATNGLQIVVDKCSVAWTESGPPYTYTCGGTLTNVIASTSVIQSSLGLGALTSGSTTHYRAKLTFPSAAGNTLQNQSSTIQYSFTGTQRAATSK
jgi:spore coat-associated protein N